MGAGWPAGERLRRLPRDEPATLAHQAKAKVTDRSAAVVESPQFPTPSRRSHAWQGIVFYVDNGWNGGHDEACLPSDIGNFQFEEGSFKFSASAYDLL